MFLFIYLIGVLLAYLIVIGYVNWSNNIEYNTTNSIKCFIISLASWIVVLLYVAIFLSIYFDKMKNKNQ